MLENDEKKKKKKKTDNFTILKLLSAVLESEAHKQARLCQSDLHRAHTHTHTNVSIQGVKFDK